MMQYQINGDKSLMHWQFIKYVWFMILALVLPSQALAYLGESDSSNLPSQYAALDINAFFNQEVISLVDMTPQTCGDVQNRLSIAYIPIEKLPPTSKSVHSDTIPAIVSMARWSVSSRFVDEGEPTFIDTPVIQEALAASFKLHLFPIAKISGWESRPSASNHRISGWKETNAMYVALNSQY